MWDKDGLVPKSIIKQDWEPLVLFWKDGKLARLTVRHHFQWRDYSADGRDEPNFDLPLRVLFVGSNHAPLVKNNKDATFDFLLSSHLRLQYKAEPIQQAPPFARKAILNLRGFVPVARQDINDRAELTVRELDGL